jgi:hypothetical protein
MNKLTRIVGYVNHRSSQRDGGGSGGGEGRRRIILVYNLALTWPSISLVKLIGV